jgi:protein-L-isoaspartate(D-aspartate) O-methyltransferase
MVDYALARRAMVDGQVNTSSVTDPRLLSAMGRIPREGFLPEARRGLAYIDDHHPLGEGRYLPAPAVFARMVQLADITASDTVLEIGSGTGYGTAVLAALAYHVTGLESVPELAKAATANLASLGVINAVVVDGSAESLGDARFDVIILAAAIEGEPTDLLGRLKAGGRLVALVRRGPTGVATRYVADRDGFKREPHFNATLPPLERKVPVESFVF